MDAKREVVDGRALSAQVEDSDLGIGHTTVEAGLGVRLLCCSQHAVQILRDSIPLADKIGIRKFRFSVAVQESPPCPRRKTFSWGFRWPELLENEFSPCSCSSDSISRDDAPS